MNIKIAARRGRVLLWSLFGVMAFGVVARYLFPYELFLSFIGLITPSYVPQELVLAEHPWTEGLHRLLGLSLLFVGMLQFSPRIRSARPQLHRWLGRTFLSLALVVAASALVIALGYPYVGSQEQVFVVTVAIMAIGLAGMAWQRVRQRRFVQHREWMIRTLALFFFIAVQRLYTLPFLLLTDWPEREIFMICNWLAVFSVLGVAEWWIHATRAAGMGGSARGVVQ